MIGIIYMYENPINGKCYIGRTTDLQKRHKEHKRMTSKKHSKFGHALNKYGIDNFNLSIILKITTTEDFELNDMLNSFEKYYVKLYDSFINGYNSTIGGEGTLGVDHRGKLNSMYGTKIKPHVLNALNSSRWIGVDQYNKNTGEYINTFKSAVDAGINTGADRGHISKCCKNKRKSAGGFAWKYSSQIINLIY